MLRRFIPHALIDRYRILRAFVANVWFWFPSRKLVVIGVTGTDGKTTTCSLITQLLVAGGKKTGMLSTVFFRVGGKEWMNETKLTTLSSWELQKNLRAMVDAGDEYAVVETSSHALDQHRMWGVAYDVAVITNTSHEHLDYHKTMQGYRAAKGKLFSALARSYRKPGIKKTTVLNVDDSTFGDYVEYAADVKIGYTGTNFQFPISNFQSDPNYQLLNYSITVSDVVWDGWTTRFVLEMNHEKRDVALSLPGSWNVANALAAAGAAFAVGIDVQSIAGGLNHVQPVLGRMERIDEGQSFTVLIDYAVTPNAFEHLYQFLKVKCQKSNVKCHIFAVFGACGERDRTKRPILGKIAARYADVVILTNEDPWHEDPHAIIEEVAIGVREGGKKEGENFFKIFDRGDAIRYAVEHANAGDIVVITGKGAETSMAVGDKKLPWDERAIVREILRSM